MKDLRNAIVLIVMTILLCCSKGWSQRVWAGGTVTIAGLSSYLIEECADTMINDTSWTNFVYRYSYDDSTWTENSLWITEIDGKIIGRNEIYVSNRYLIYDFSLNLHDTFNHVFWPLSNRFVVVEEDSVVILGAQRKRLRLRHVTEMFDDIWVEGIGSVLHDYFSPCEDPTRVDFGSSLNCFKESPNSETWQYDNSLNCLIDQVELVCMEYSSATDIKLEKQISIFPNPFTDKLFVNYHSTITSYFIYSIDGSLLIYDQATQQELELTSKVQDLPPGIYYIRLLGDTGMDVLPLVKI